MQLESPEACHLLPSIETVLGDDIFIMTKLNKLIDNLEISNNNVKAYDRPYSPIDSKLFSVSFSNKFSKQEANDLIFKTRCCPRSTATLAIRF